MKRALLGLVVGCMTLGLASVAMAGDNANAGISLHITKYDPNSFVDCSSFTYRVGSSQPFDVKGEPCPHGEAFFNVWVVVCNGSDSTGVAGAEFGLSYDGRSGIGVDVLPGSWLLCADLEFQGNNWPRSGTGNLVTWEPSLNCQMTNLQPWPRSAYAVAGLMTVFVRGQDEMAITPRPASGRLKVADCASVEDDLTDAVVHRGGIARFCTNRNGYNFCRNQVLDTEATTWGKIKAKYGAN